MVKMVHMVHNNKCFFHHVGTQVKKGAVKSMSLVALVGYSFLYLALLVHHEDGDGVPAGLDPVHDLLVVLPANVRPIDLHDDIVSSQASGRGGGALVNLPCRTDMQSCQRPLRIPLLEKFIKTLCQGAFSGHCSETSRRFVIYSLTALQ